MPKKNTGKFRIVTDKFYTIQKTVLICLEKLSSYHNILISSKLIEPSAGSGAFIKELTNYDVDAYDIDPPTTNFDIKKMNFLDVDLTQYNKPLVFIGNPPFGRQSSIAKKFIKKISNYDNTNIIAFILPKSFKKESMQKCFNLFFWLESEIDLPKTSFTINGNPHNVPCIFQIWVRKESKRQIKPVEYPKSFTYVKKNENPDFSLRRVGVNAGFISESISDKSEQSHYFIKLKNNIDKNNFIDKFKTIEFEHNNTVGPKSISKKEFTHELNLII